MTFSYIRIFSRKGLSVNSLKSAIGVLNFHSNKGALHAVAVGINYDARKTMRVPFLPVKRSLCVNHKMQKLNEEDSFYDLLKEIESKNVMPQDFIMNCISRMEFMLEHQWLECSQKRQIRESAPFVKLFLEIRENRNLIPPKDLIQILKVCQNLEIAFDSRFCVSLLSEVAMRLYDLDFQKAVNYLILLDKSLSSRCAIKLKRHLREMIYKEINDKSYLKSSDYVGAAVNVGCFLSVSPEMVKTILCDVIDLEVWNSQVIFQKILNIFLRLAANEKNDINENLFKKINEEISKCTDATFITNFLFTYGKIVKDKRLICDLQLTENAINKAIELNMEGRDLMKLSISLDNLGFVHHKFLEYLIYHVRKKPDMTNDFRFLQTLIKLLAFSNCDQGTLNRWKDFAPDLKNCHALKTLLEDSRKFTRHYTVMILELVSLGVFIDEELNHLSKPLNEASIEATKWTPKATKIRLFLTYIHEAVKVLHPSFPKPLLADNVVRIIRPEMKKTNPKCDFDGTEMSQILSERTQVRVSMIINCRNKSGIEIDGGVVAVNEEGKLFDFTSVIEEFHSKGKEIYLEDIEVPEGFKLMFVIPLLNRDHAVNTCDLTPKRALQIQIWNALKYPTVLIYQRIWDELHEEEKGDYLYSKIRDEYFARI